MESGRYPSTAASRSVSFTASPRVALGDPEIILRGAEHGLDARRGLDVTADGEAFVFVRAVEDEEGDAWIDGIHVVQNWIREFE